MNLAILDDYQHLALQSADWDRLRRRGVEITVFHDAFASEEEAAARLAPFEIVCLMRERAAAAELGRMKPESILVNTSRGPIVDEAAPIAALKSGRPGHAALDVYDREPLPVDHPLRGMDNVTLSPHLGYVSADVMRAFYADTVENVEAWLEGKPLRVLNPEAPR